METSAVYHGAVRWWCWLAYLCPLAVSVVQIRHAKVSSELHRINKNKTLLPIVWCWSAILLSQLLMWSCEIFSSVLSRSLVCCSCVTSPSFTFSCSWVVVRFRCSDIIFSRWCASCDTHISWAAAHAAAAAVVTVVVADRDHCNHYFDHHHHHYYT